MREVMMTVQRQTMTPHDPDGDIGAARSAGAATDYEDDHIMDADEDPVAFATRHGVRMEGLRAFMDLLHLGTIRCILGRTLQATCAGHHNCSACLDYTDFNVAQKALLLLLSHADTTLSREKHLYIGRALGVKVSKS